MKVFISFICEENINNLLRESHEKGVDSIWFFNFLINHNNYFIYFSLWESKITNL